MVSSLIPLSKRGKGMSIFSIFQNIGLVVGATLGGFLFEIWIELPFIACGIIGFIGVLLTSVIIAEPTQSLQ
jgi:MFS family permease